MCVNSGIDIQFLFARKSHNDGTAAQRAVADDAVGSGSTNLRILRNEMGTGAGGGPSRSAMASCVQAEGAALESVDAQTRLLFDALLRGEVLCEFSTRHV